MATKLEYSQLSLYVYNTANDQNRPLLPTGWTQVAYHPDDAIGFSYGIFRNTATNEVVVAYTGTNEKKVVDFLVANLPAGVGLGSPQVTAAAYVAAQTIKTYGIENVSFTGHSLGGGHRPDDRVVLLEPVLLGNGVLQDRSLGAAAIHRRLGRWPGRCAEQGRRVCREVAQALPRGAGHHLFHQSLGEKSVYLQKYPLGVIDRQIERPARATT
jgi:hypothetical protein